MKLVDVNILVHAVNTDAAFHGEVLAWWKRNLSADGVVCLTWFALVGFIRISTHPSILRSPLPLRVALEEVEAWISHPNTQLISESADHLRLISELLSEVDGAGNLCSDAHLAAIAIGNGATLVSCDRDFAKFSKLRWENPLAPT